MKKKKLLIFMFSLGGGGIQKFVINLIHELNLEKYEISIALVNKKGVYLNSIPEQIKLIDLKAKRTYFSLLPLIRCIKKERPDIVFAVGTTLNLVAILAKLITKDKSRLIIRQAIDLKVSANSKFKLFLVKKLYNKADRCVALTKDMKANIIQLTGLQDSEITVIYNSINITDIEKRKRENAEELTHINEKKIIAVGRLAKQKNMTMLVDAFYNVLKETESKLIILGEGKEKEVIKSRIAKRGIQDNVLMLGYQANPYKYLYQSDVFVLPSLFEGLSNALLEALACEIPIVTTDNPDNIIQDGINGFHAKLTPIDIAKKINKILSSESLSNQIILNNNEYKRNFNITTMVTSYETIFNEV